MTNATNPTGPITASGLYRWEVPGKPVTVYLSLDLVDRLEKEVIEAFKAVTKRGSEIGGVLLGRTAQDGKNLILVEDCETVECEYARGPLFLMSDDDRAQYEAKLAEVKSKGFTTVGFFRSNTRRDVALDDDDQGVLQQYHGKPENVLLLVKPFAMKPSVGAFFIWENGSLHGEESYLPFPFKRAELEKDPAQIVKPNDPALKAFFQQALPVNAPPAPKPEPPRVSVPRVDAPPPPPPMAKAPEPPPAPRVQAPPPRREEPREPLKPPAPAPAAKEPVKPAAQVRREEPKREEPKREEPKREDVRKEEPKKEEKPAAAAPVPFKREERAPITPMPRPEQRPAGPVLVKKDEAAAKADEKPAPPSRRDDKPAVTPVTVRGGAVAAPKEDLKPAPMAPPAPAAKAEPLTAPAFGQPVEERILAAEAQPSTSFFANKWLWIVLVLVVVAVGGFFAYRQFLMPAPAATTVSENLDLRAERNAGQLMVTWNREASSIQRAERATLSIKDGDHKEDVDLDLGLLRKGSIIYTPLTNDVSFRLEVADLKGGRSASEEVRVLAGRPSPAVGMPGSPEAPQNLTPQAAQAEKPTAQTPAPAEVAAAKPTEAPAPVAPTPAEPKVTATPVVTAQPAATGSLAARLSAPQLDEAPISSLPGGAVPTVSTPSAPPPTQAPTARPTTAQPAATAAQTRIGGVVQEARLISRQPVVYPALARQARVSGTVRVEAVIGTDGKVKSARALNGPPLLRQAATDAVKKWLYQPAMLNGQPTEVTTQVDLTFSPGR